MQPFSSLSDDELEQRLEREQARSKRALSKRERATAHNNVKAIIREQTIRFERRWGL